MYIYMGSGGKMKWSDQTHYGINCHNVYLYLLFLQFMGKKTKKYMNDWLKPSKTTDVLVNLYAMDALYNSTNWNIGYNSFTLQEVLVFHRNQGWYLTQLYQKRKFSRRQNKLLEKLTATNTTDCYRGGLICDLYVIYSTN